MTLCPAHFLPLVRERCPELGCGYRFSPEVHRMTFGDVLVMGELTATGRVVSAQRAGCDHDFHDTPEDGIVCALCGADGYPCGRCEGEGKFSMLDGGMMPRPSGAPLPTFPCPECKGKGLVAG